MAISNAKSVSRPGMKMIPGGVFAMGSTCFYPEEGPVRQVRVAPFLVDEVPVTNTEFAQFMAATGHITVAEIAPTEQDYPGLLPDMAIAGSTVFDSAQPTVDIRNPASWWTFRQGADWSHPLGPGSDIHQLGQHPVVHVAYADAQAYAQWAGKALPTEAQWEYAARGGLDGVEYAWGDDLVPNGTMMANYWQGQFPFTNTLLDGWERTSPVRSYAANGHGLFDMIGNVWEWTRDCWSLPANSATALSCCGVEVNPRGGVEQTSHAIGFGGRISRKVIKGGSHLCALNYCRRYRPAARHPQSIDSPTGHIGFRCVVALDLG